MTENAQNAGRLRVSDLSQGRGTAFDLRPEGPELEAIGRELGLVELRKLRFSGQITPEGKSGWRIQADLGSTVVQSCVVTLKPVTTRIDQPVTRRFLRDVPEVGEAEDETEMPEDVTIEELGDTIDLRAVMVEALALALPDYPRADQAALEQTDFGPPGAAPLTDADTKPFAALAGLKRKLEDDT